MSNLPSLTTTYIRSFKLYGQSFFIVLPFVLGLMLCKYLLNTFIPQSNEVNLIFFVRMLGDLAISALFFSFMINVMYHKYKKLGEYIPALINGARRFAQIFLVYILLCLPIILILALMEIAYQFWVPYVITQSVAQILLWSSLLAIGIAMLVTMALYVFSFMAGIYIAINNESILLALKHSWKVVKPVWLDTLLLLVILGMIYVSLDLLLSEFQVPYVYLVMTLLLSSFTPALMLIHWEHVEKVSYDIEASLMLKALAIK